MSTIFRLTTFQATSPSRKFISIYPLLNCGINSALGSTVHLMGWLPSFSTSSPEDAKKPTTPTGNSTTSNPTKDGAFIAPDRLSRAKCWDARDGFNSCLDRNNILDAIKDKDAADKACGKELQEFEQSCASSWVTYFKQRRVAEYEKKQLLEKQEAATRDSFSQ